LVAVCDPACERAQPGVVDQTMFQRSNETIQMEYQTLTDPTSTKQQVIQAFIYKAVSDGSVYNIRYFTVAS